MIITESDLKKSRNKELYDHSSLLNNKQLINKIINAYNTQYTEEMSPNNLKFNYGNGVNIWTSGFAPISTSREALKDVNLLCKNLKNFGRTEISRGFSAYGELFDNDGDVASNMNWKYKKWEEMTSGSFDDSVLFYPPEIGNLYGFENEHGVMVNSSARNSYNAYQITNILNTNITKSEKIILEIGSGWGAIPYNLFKFNNYKGKYIIIDLPETNMVSTYFLSESLPDKRVVTLAEHGNFLECLENCDILILPASFVNKISNLPEGFIDLCYNSHSITEMPKDIVLNYFLLINRIVKKSGWFLNKNHDENWNVDAIIQENFNWKLVNKQFETLQTFKEDNVYYEKTLYYESLYEL